MDFLTGIPDLIERCIQVYNFVKDVKGAPKACSELMNALDMSLTALKEIKEHGFVGDDSKKNALSAQVKKYQSTLDSFSKEFGDEKLTLKGRIKWVCSNEKKLKALKDDLNESNTQLSLLMTLGISYVFFSSFVAC